MSTSLKGIAVMGGIALGPWFVYDPTPPVVSKVRIEGTAVESEKARFQQAIEASIAEVTQLRDRVELQLGEEEAEIFDAHLLLFEDDTLLDGTYQRIEQEHKNAEWALSETTDEIAQMFAEIEDEYLRARGADIQDIRLRLLNHLQGRPTAQLDHLREPTIVIARDLLPSDTAGLDPKLVLGLATEQGGPTSHTAILSRQLRIPAVVAIPGLLEHVSALHHHDDHKMVLDARTGELLLTPDAATLQQYQADQVVYQQQQQQLALLKDQPAITPDGIRVEVAANIGRSADAGPAVEAGATGVGLFRTEFLFLERTSAPTEEEQVAAYSTVLQAFTGKTVIVRTLDIGGDKSVPYLDLPKEDNPFLGLRGIRLCLAPHYQHLFRTQVRALLLAAQENSSSTLWLMFPMICDVRELREAKAFVAETEQQLLQDSQLTAPVLARIQQGIMIETPAAVWLLDQLAKEADFFSIGTNDLAQYILVSDRLNANLAELHRPFHPAVMRTIAHIIRTARQLACWVGMCGEMAGDPRASAFLLGLGINELSMEASSLNAVKQAIRSTSGAQAQDLVTRVLAAETATDIEALLS
ncbi:phosphoenolpyruvate-protein phosphotransferase [Dictyobacter alpinus]|uniref:Phosphoenolpyruvate-protein phosphotransferase n=1 Tax=Dictyobacter alpinus TaxID=2014873 RepID=A0A402B8X2_9CHLR|nr:phosphoenolpyruvate--protein phosphotransferase [Dictyobacter alpinus]GCE27795.1 phosphoenolpyruvate-protein phosphotransferase [Dictyobacter alpinus]